MLQSLQAYTPSVLDLVECAGLIGFLWFLWWWRSLPLEDDGFGNEQYKSASVPRRRVPMPWEADPAPAVPPSPLPAYDPRGACAKCGATDAGGAYRAYSPDFKFLPAVSGPGRRRWSYEHMERRCPCCGYVWAEAPVAKDPAGGAR